MLCKIPVFDREKKLYAYELRYEKEESNLNQLAKNLYYIISNLDIKKFLNNKQAFIKVFPDVIIFTDFLNLINKEVFILEIDSKYLKSKSVVEKLKELRENGFVFSLEVSEGDFNVDYYLQFSGIFEYLSVSFNNINVDKENFLKQVVELPFTFKAEDLDTYEDFEKALSFGFNLFEGEFFTKPERLAEKEETINKLEILKLIRYVSQEEELNDIAEAIKANPDVAIRLIKYINSSFFYLANPITSVNRAVAYLGKKNLLSWLFLLSMMAVAKNDLDKEVIKLALFRGKFMELLSLKINPDENVAETAFLVGVLSLAERVFGRDLKSVLKELNLSEDFENVISEGYFGELLNFVISIEKNDILQTKKFKSVYLLSDEDIAGITVETYNWIDTMFEVLT